MKKPEFTTMRRHCFDLSRAVHNSRRHLGLVIAVSSLTIAASCTSRERPNSDSIAPTCDAAASNCTSNAGYACGANLQTDNANCGCCGNACSTGTLCRAGHCEQTAFGFFVFGDMHSGPTQNNSTLAAAARQMRRIDSNPVAVFSNGDLVDTGAESQWLNHDALVAEAGWLTNAACAPSLGAKPRYFGAKPRYFGAVGDHDIMTNDWSQAWNEHLKDPLQQAHTDGSGVSYSLEFANALFVVLDSENVSNDATSEPQTPWLASVLAGSTSPLKFLFFHEPVYPCNNRHAPLTAALPWVNLAERAGANVIFNSHTHVYTRSCPKRDGNCVTDNAGIVFVETGSVGGIPRQVDVTEGTNAGTDADGNARTDAYDCILGQQLRAAHSTQNTFCHVSVNGCDATVQCFAVGDNDTPLDTFTVSGCNRDE